MTTNTSRKQRPGCGQHSYVRAARPCPSKLTFLSVSPLASSQQPRSRLPSTSQVRRREQHSSNRYRREQRQASRELRSKASSRATALGQGQVSLSLFSSTSTNSDLPMCDRVDRPLIIRACSRAVGTPGRARSSCSSNSSSAEVAGAG